MVTVADAKAKFEEFYGVDKDHRTREQWINLVDTYGMKVVMKKEGFKKSEVKKKIK